MRYLIVLLLFVAAGAHAQTTCTVNGQPGVITDDGNGNFTCGPAPMDTSSSSSGGTTSGSSSSGATSSSSSGTTSTGGGSTTDTSTGGVFTAFASWLKSFLLYIPQWCWQELLAAFASIINAIPVPSWFASFTSAAGAFTSDALYWLNFIQFKQGLAMVSAALLARWLLRRIPFIG